MAQLKNPDRHRYSIVAARPDPATRQAVREVLDAHEWTMNDFLIACMKLAAVNPDAMLGRLAQFRPKRSR